MTQQKNSIVKNKIDSLEVSGDVKIILYRIFENEFNYSGSEADTKRFKLKYCREVILGGYQNEINKNKNL